MKGSKSSGAPLTNTASRVRPMGGGNLGNSSPGTEGLSNTANRAITPKKFNASSPDFGMLGTTTIKAVKAKTGNRHSPGI